MTKTVTTKKKLTKIKKEPMAASKKRNPHSEAAQKIACDMLIKREAGVLRDWLHLQKPCLINIISYKTGETIAWFDLRDCYRKRQPLKGIKKALSKAIQPRKPKAKAKSKKKVTK